MDATLHERPLSVAEAYGALEQFGTDLGRVRLLLLMHAAVPQSFRADLLNLLKVNFLAAEAGADLTVDSDVLLSSLVQPAAAGYYRLDPEVRRHCLALLDSAYRDRPVRRTVEVARFLLTYAGALERQAGLRLDPLLAEYLAIQRWVAVAFIDPRAAAEAFAAALNGVLDSASPAAALRLGGVTAAISIPLTGHEGLLAYARSIDAIGRGDDATAERLLDWMGDADVRVGGVTLRPAREVMGRVEAPAEAVPKEQPPPRLIGLPDRVGIVNGREDELNSLRKMLIPSTDGRDQVRRPNVVSIVGGEGAGKWAIANALAHDETIQAGYDAIIWLGEDEHGYPTTELEEFANAVGVTDLIDRADGPPVINQQRFRELFDEFRVLFIGDERTASEILPTIATAAGATCALLKLVPAGRKRGPGLELVLAPIAGVYAEHSLVRLLGGSFPVGTLVAFTGGNPLVTRLVEYAVDQRWGGPRQRTVAGELPKLEARGVPEKVTAILREILTSLSPTDVSLLEEISTLPTYRTQFHRDELTSFGITNPDGFVSLLYAFADVLGTTIRIHPLIRETLQELVRTRQSRPAPQASPERVSEPSPGAPTAFLSYTSEDSQAARLIADGLRSLGLEVFDFHATERMDDPALVSEIETAIGRADLFVPVLSRAILARTESMVFREWRAALERSRRTDPSVRFIIPVAIDDLSQRDVATWPELNELQWEHAPKGHVSETFLQIVRAAIRDRRLHPDPQDLGPATDYAIVMGVSRYTALNLTLPETVSEAEAAFSWLSDQEMPRGRMHRLTGETSAAASYDTFRGILENLVELGEKSTYRDGRLGRRLYIYFSGLVALVGDSEPALVTADASAERVQHIAIRDWVDWLQHAGLFDELVIWIDGRLALSLPQFRAEPVPFARLYSRTPSRALFVATATQPIEEVSKGLFTNWLMKGLSGAATDSDSGRVTAASLASYLQTQAGRHRQPRIVIQLQGPDIVLSEAVSRRNFTAS